MARHGHFRRPARALRDLAGGPRLQGQEGRRHRLGRHGGDADPGDRRQDCAHVTMLQRSPTFFITGRNANDLAETLRQLQIDEAWIHEIVRRKILYDQAMFTRRCVRGAGRRRQGADRRACATISGPTTTSTRTSRRATGRGGSASPSFRMPTCSRRSRAGKASVVTDEIERFNETGIQLEIRQAARRRHHRRGDRLQHQRAGRHRLRRRRQAARLCRHRHLSRHDVHGHAQPGLGVRLFPRQLDAARRHGRRLRVPAAQAHGRDRRQESLSGAAARGPGHAAAAVDRHGELQSRLHHARACICCPSAATSRNGSTARTTGPRRTSSRPSTCAMRRSSTSEGGATRASGSARFLHLPRIGVGEEQLLAVDL